MTDTHIQYLGPEDFHDGSVVAFDHSGDQVIVSVKGYTGRIYDVVFSGVKAVSSEKPVGMTLYALSERRGDGNGRQFIFTNWDDDGDSKLEIVARDVSIRDREAAI